VRRWSGQILWQAVLYGSNGVATGLLYSAVAWGLLAATSISLTGAVVIAYAVSVLGNYVGSRLIFRPTHGIGEHGLRYLAVVAFSFASTAFWAWVLDRPSVPAVVSVYAPVLLTTIPTFLLLRRWVFRSS
jgi:putative flippase GtrA